MSLRNFKTNLGFGKVPQEPKPAKPTDLQQAASDFVLRALNEDRADLHIKAKPQPTSQVQQNNSQPLIINTSPISQGQQGNIFEVPTPESIDGELVEEQPQIESPDWAGNFLRGDKKKK